MLTDTKCRNAKPKEKPYKLPDANGLYLEVKPNGTKTWRYRFELSEGEKRKEGTFTIGEYGAPPAGETSEQGQTRRNGSVFTLVEAREERTKARALVKQGISPVRNRKTIQLKAQFAASDIFEPFAKEWITLKDWEEITKKRRQDMLERVVFPYIGQLPLREIAPAHILDVLTKAAKNNGITVKDEAKRTLFGIFELAVETERVDSNPVRQWRGVLPVNKTQHKEALSKEDMIPDPDMQIAVYPKLELAEALAYQDSFCYREIYCDDKGTEDIKAKKELNAFLDQWLSNLIEQGHCIKADEQS